jgi:MoxR-like ATPase
MSAETAVAATEPAMPVEEFRRLAGRVEDEVGKLIVGQQEILREVLICLIAGGHALLEGVPGLGKTMLIRTLAETLDLSFSRIQFTPDLMPADITGTNILAEDEHGAREFRFQPGPIFANLVLADEINRATPKTQSALLEAMQEASVTVANQTYRLPPPFFVLATQNPLEMEGTYPLPEAQLDRFLFKLLVRFPSAAELGEILNRTTTTALPRVRKVASGEQIVQMSELAREVPIASHVRDYVVRLVLTTHPDSATAPAAVRKYVRYGASPRGAQAIVLGAKIRALLEGRLNVAFEDIRALAAPALRHRLVLNFEGEAEGLTTDEVIEEVLAKTNERG